MKLTLNQSEFIVLKGIIDDRLNSLKKNIAKHSDSLDRERVRDIIINAPQFALGG